MNQQIKNLLSIFPLKTERCEILLLTEDDIQWYIQCIKSEFFKDVVLGYVGLDMEVIRKGLKRLVRGYGSGVGVGEVRVVVFVGGVRVGSIVLLSNKLDKDSPLLGYWIVPEHQKAGIATEAVGQVVREVHKNGYSVGAVVLRNNISSINLLKKLGFSQSGVSYINNHLTIQYKSIKDGVIS